MSYIVLGVAKSAKAYQNEMRVPAEPSRAEGSMDEVCFAPWCLNIMNSLHILVVEDEPILRDDIATYLRDCGCAIYEAATAEEAILMCSTVSLRLHVLFTDIHLNGAAVGLEVADVFRAARPAIGLLYTSGNPLNRARCLPGSRFLPKPKDKAEVLKTCRDMHRGRISSEGCMLGLIGFRSWGSSLGRRAKIKCETDLSYGTVQV